jgi:hypothetical protein
VGTGNFGDGCISIGKWWEWLYLRMEWGGIHRDQPTFIQFFSGLCNGGSLFVYHVINFIDIHWCRYVHLILVEILVSIASNCLTLICKDGCSSIHIGSMQIRTASWNSSPTSETCKQVDGGRDRNKHICEDGSGLIWTIFFFWRHGHKGSWWQHSTPSCPAFVHYNWYKVVWDLVTPNVE